MPSQNIITMTSDKPQNGGKREIVNELLNVEELLNHAMDPEVRAMESYDNVAPLIIESALHRLRAAFDMFDKDPELGPLEV
jgi:hypothetical protein